MAVPEQDLVHAACGSTIALPVSVGRIVGGKYELLRLLGRGSMGEVWVARHQSLDDRVALKLLTRSLVPGEGEDAATALARFRFEAQVAARLARGTKHIVRVSDHGEEGALAYLVMELLEGQTLETTLLRYSALPPARVASLLRQAARGLDHAHAQGIIHRDLKPANVFLTRDEGGASLVKLLDFGIARALGPAGPDASPFATAANMILGTPGYMSPEHANGAEPDRQCDLWALATIAYEALTGELPVGGVDAQELLANLLLRAFVPLHERAPELPAALAPFFERAFAALPDHRYASAEEMARAFASAIDGTKSGEFAESARHDAAHATDAALAAAAATARRSAMGPTQGAPTLRVASERPPTQARARARAKVHALAQAQVRGGAPSKRARLGSAGVLVGLALAGGFALALALVWGHRAPDEPALAGSVVETAPGATASGAAPPEPAGPAAPVDAPAPAPPRGAVAEGVGPPTGTPALASAPAPASASASLPAPPSASAPFVPPIWPPSCDPPFTYDAQGTKRWKRGCF